MTDQISHNTNELIGIADFLNAQQVQRHADMTHQQQRAAIITKACCKQGQQKICGSVILFCV